MKKGKVEKLGALLVAGFFLVFLPWEVAIGESSEPVSETVAKASIVEGLLTLSVQWASDLAVGAPATVELKTGDGNLVASNAVLVSGGEVTIHTLSHDAGLFASHGYGYTVHLEDGNGAELAAPLPVLVSLCAPDEICLYRVVEGIGTDGVAMPIEVLRLLDELADEGSGDLLGDALGERPDLGHHLYWVGDQISRLPGGQDSPSCLCAWQAGFGLDPAAEDEYNPDLGAFAELRRVRGSGANSRLGAQIYGGENLHTEAFSETRLHLALRCHLLSPGTTVQWGQQALSIPLLQVCEKECADARVDIDASLESRSVSNAWATETYGAFGSASAGVDVTILPQIGLALAIMTSAVADRHPGNFELQEVPDFEVENRGWTVWGSGTEVTFVAEGESEVCLQRGEHVPVCTGRYFPPLPNGIPWAYARSEAFARADLSGFASCAVKDVTFGNLKPVSLGGGTNDGLVIVPWNP